MSYPATILTGASKGLGSALAKRLATKYTSSQYLILISRTQNDQISEPEYLFKENIIHLQMDLSDLNQSNYSLLHQTIQHNGLQITQLINNAGLWGTNGKLLSQNIDEVSEILKINTLAPLNLIQQLHQNNYFAQQSRILNISTLGAQIPIPGLHSYCITKAALQMALQCLRKELSKDIVINSLRPGVVNTNMLQSLQQYGQIEITNQQNVLQSDLVAQFVEWVLSLDQKQFQNKMKEWDIYDQSHHSNWLEQNQTIPSVIPNFKFIK